MSDAPSPPPRLEHIGIAVDDLDAARERYERILGVPPSPVEEVPSEHVRVCFFELANCRIELLAPTGPEGAVHRFLAQGRRGVHHVAVEDEHSSAGAKLAELASAGVETIGGVRPGSRGTEVFFLHPRSTGGVLLEFVGRPAGSEPA